MSHYITRLHPLHRAYQATMLNVKTQHIGKTCKGEFEHVTYSAIKNTRLSEQAGSTELARINTDSPKLRSSHRIPGNAWMLLSSDGEVYQCSV